MFLGNSILNTMKITCLTKFNQPTYCFLNWIVVTFTKKSLSMIWFTRSLFSTSILLFLSISSLIPYLLLKSSNLLLLLFSSLFFFVSKVSTQFLDLFVFLLTKFFHLGLMLNMNNYTMIVMDKYVLNYLMLNL